MKISVKWSIPPRHAMAGSGINKSLPCLCSQLPPLLAWEARALISVDDYDAPDPNEPALFLRQHVQQKNFCYDELKRQCVHSVFTWDEYFTISSNGTAVRPDDHAFNTRMYGMRCPQICLDMSAVVCKLDLVHLTDPATNAPITEAQAQSQNGAFPVNNPNTDNPHYFLQTETFKIVIRDHSATQATITRGDTTTQSNPTFAVTVPRKKKRVRTYWKFYPAVEHCNRALPGLIANAIQGGPPLNLVAGTDADDGVNVVLPWPLPWDASNWRGKMSSWDEDGDKIDVDTPIALLQPGERASELVAVLQSPGGMPRSLVAGGANALAAFWSQQSASGFGPRGRSTVVTSSQGQREGIVDESMAIDGPLDMESAIQFAPGADEWLSLGDEE